MTDLAALVPRAAALLERARAAGVRIALAESCTGGLVAALLTEVPGSSDVVERGFVTYSNQAKIDLLGVPAELLRAHGAVSREVARAMAQGALARSTAEIAVAVTGIAGPGGGSADKPVGLVHFGGALRGGATHSRERRFGDIGRSAVRLASVKETLVALEELLQTAEAARERKRSSRDDARKPCS